MILAKESGFFGAVDLLALYANIITVDIFQLWAPFIKKLAGRAPSKESDPFLITFWQVINDAKGVAF